MLKVYLSKKKLPDNDSQKYTITSVSHVKTGKLVFYPFNDSLTLTNGKFEFTGTTGEPMLAMGGLQLGIR